MELDTVTQFTPVASLAGGVLIGLSAVMVMAIFGGIAGISGITSTALFKLDSATKSDDSGWRLTFIVGLVAAPLVYLLLTGGPVLQTVPSSIFGMGLAGLLVGTGVSMGSGCTSGHGLCGLARLSPRSLVAVLTFMSTAGVTVFVLRHVI